MLLIINWSGSVISIYTDTDTWSKLGNENALLMMNHSNELDWLVGWVLADQFNILGVSRSNIFKQSTINKLFYFSYRMLSYSSRKLSNGFLLLDGLGNLPKLDF